MASGVTFEGRQEKLISRRCVAPAALDADFVQLPLQLAIEFVVHGGQRVGKLLDAACAKNDRGYCRIRQ
jgi:hypothetical protein